jgi:acyl carrier protein
MSFEEFYKLIASALEVEESSIDLESDSENTSEWDSLGHLSILQALNDAIGDDFQLLEGVAQCTSTKSLSSILIAHGYLKDVS